MLCDFTNPYEKIVNLLLHVVNYEGQNKSLIKSLQVATKLYYKRLFNLSQISHSRSICSVAFIM